MKLIVVSAFDVFPSSMEGRWWFETVKRRLGRNYSNELISGKFSIYEKGIPQCSDRYLVYPTEAEVTEEYIKDVFMPIICDVAKDDIAELKAHGIKSPEDLVFKKDIKVEDFSFLADKEHLYIKE